MKFLKGFFFKNFGITIINIFFFSSTNLGPYSD
jgi:hypothetical protein